ncbi:hypothetical protein ACSFE6_10070 [Pseudomonas baetica]
MVTSFSAMISKANAAYLTPALRQKADQTSFQDFGMGLHFRAL